MVGKGKEKLKEAINWFAAEYGELEKLDGLLKEAEQAGLGKKRTKLKKAYLVARYVRRAEAKGEGNLHPVLEVLGKAKDKEIVGVVKELKVPESKLIEATPFLGSLRKGLKHVRAEVKLEKKYPSNKLETKIQREIKQLEIKVEDLERWVAALERCLQIISRRGFLKKAGTAAVGLAAATIPGVAWGKRKGYKVYRDDKLISFNINKISLSLQLLVFNYSNLYHPKFYKKIKSINFYVDGKLKNSYLRINTNEELCEKKMALFCNHLPVRYGKHEYKLEIINDYDRVIHSALKRIDTTGKVLRPQVRALVSKKPKEISVIVYCYTPLTPKNKKRGIKELIVKYYIGKYEARSKILLKKKNYPSGGNMTGGLVMEKFKIPFPKGSTVNFSVIVTDYSGNVVHYSEKIK